MRLQIAWISTIAAVAAIASSAAGLPLTAQDRAELFAQLDANKDGYVSADEVPAEQRAKFERLLKLAGKESEQKLNKALFEGAVKAAKEGAKGSSVEAPPAVRPDGRASQGDDLFAKLDANKDGVVAAEEVSESQKTAFEQLLKNGDIDGDGKLSREEYAASTQATGTPRQPGRGGGPPGQGRPGFPLTNPRELLARMDRNQDGKLSKDELPPRLQENFDRIDANGDGTIGEDEFGRLAGVLGQRPPGVGGGPPPGMPPMGVFALLDTDRDGQLSTSEIVAAGSVLLKLDRNGDGKLTPDEVFAGMPRRPEQQ